MNQKSITFRCSAAQQLRLLNALKLSNGNRTDFIIAALEHFLLFAESESAQHMDLFAMVDYIDSIGHGPTFAEQACS